MMAEVTVWKVFKALFWSKITKHCFHWCFYIFSPNCKNRCIKYLPLLETEVLKKETDLNHEKLLELCVHQKVVKVVSHYTASLRKTHTNGRLSTPLIYTLTCQISFSMNIFKRTSQKSLLYRTGCLDVFLNFACKIKAHLSKTIRIFSVAPNGLGVEAKFRRR